MRVAIVGSGPAGLMAATQLSQTSGIEIHLFEKRAGLGRKLLIAGSSGLNISHHAHPKEFAQHYEGGELAIWSKLFQAFGPAHWIEFIEKQLGMETFLGTSDRYFVREMKASGLLKRWQEFLETRGVKIHSAQELTDFASTEEGVRLAFNHTELPLFQAAGFFLGGGSWESETPAWIKLFQNKKIEMNEFKPSNVGYEVAWKPEFLREAEGKPLKKIVLSTPLGEKAGELMVTGYGLEGTPIYFYGTPGRVYLDLKPDLSLEQILAKLSEVKENLAPLRRVKQKLSLGEASQALLFHHTPPEMKANLGQVAARIKKFPLDLLKPRPLAEAISSRGGVVLSELTPQFELKKYKNIYCGGEMLDWDAPTGGFLIQASISQGAVIGKSIHHTSRITSNPL